MGFIQGYIEIHRVIGLRVSQDQGYLLGDPYNKGSIWGVYWGLVVHGELQYGDQ